MSQIPSDLSSVRLLHPNTNLNRLSLTLFSHSVTLNMGSSGYYTLRVVREINEA